MTETMQRWSMNALGRESLQLVQVPVSQPGPGEVRVRVNAVALNYRDKMVIEGTMPIPLSFPFTPASDMAGVVDSIGEGVTRFKPGARVISTFFPEWIDGKPQADARNLPYKTSGGYFQGMLAEYVIVSENALVASPESLDDAEASTLPCAGLTAWFALVERGHLRAGQSVLVQGTGGVSIFALQFAKMAGATVIATSSSDEKLERLKALGADHVINYRKDTRWGETARALTGGRGVDHIIEVGGPATLEQSMIAVRVAGHISIIGILSGVSGAMDFVPALVKQVRLQGVLVGSRSQQQDMIRAINANGMRPVIDRHFPLTDIVEAFKYQETNQHFGKIILDI